MNTKLNHLIIGLALTLLAGSPTLADDTEIFFGSGSGPSSADPNIMLVLDTSGSMGSNVISTTPFVPATDYTGNCDDNYVYFRNTSRNTLPQCNSDGTVSNNSSYTRERERVASASFYCSPATTAFTTAGYYSVNAIRWTTISTSNNSGSSYTNSYRWRDTLYPEPDTSGTNRTLYTLSDVACENHNYAGSYPNGVSPTSATEWTTTSSNSYWNQTTNREEFVFYSANYLNWHHEHRIASVQTRMQIVQSAAKSLLDSLSGVNVGLMRYDSQGSGGMVMSPVQNVDTARAGMKTEIDSWFPDGDTPLSETLSEAYRYFTGGTVNYGTASNKCNDDGFGGCTTVPTPSVASSRNGGTLVSTSYQTPMTHSCQKNYVVFLTDGEPTNDSQANTYINGLSTSDAACSNSGGCLGTLTSYMYGNDLSTTLTDKQNITTYFIGFGSEVSGGAPFAYLDAAATAGGGDAFTAGDLDSLTTALNDIITSIKDDSSNFTAPSVAVNAFNKTQVLEDLYISVFKPALKTHWAGNLKKYKLRPVTTTDNSTTPPTVTTDLAIVGVNASTVGSAVDSSTGFFKDTARSYWSATVDGKDTEKGGAASVIPAPAQRKVYTYIGSNPSPGALPDLSSNVAYSVEDANSSITDAILGIGDPGAPPRTTLINWARGQDIKDDDSDLNTTEARGVMGDPIHAQPSVVIYGNSGSTTTAKLNDAVVYITTNDGYLHAINVADGVELWSFIPQNLLNNLENIYTNASSNTKTYTLDGNLRVLKYDVDGDGVVETGDRVFLYFSQGRGGDKYYALDVTNKTQPKFMWSLGSSDLGGIVSQSWSTPALGKVRLAGATQNPQRLVLIFGGGYDSAEDSQSYNASGDAFGKGIFMVDAVRGTLLWSQTYSSDTTSAFNKMTHAIPSSVAVLDTNGDGWTDRMYAGDMAGQLWRFDVFSGAANTTSDPLVTGGVIASIGAKAAGTPSIANNRSFYNEPDISKFVIADGANYYAISIGSGDRALPKSNTTTQDRFYSFRDYNLQRMTQTLYNSYAPITEADLTSITGNSASAIGISGWMLPLSTKEKALAQSLTINGKVLFTTFVPDAASSACSVSTGGGRAYAIDLKTGYKVFTDLYQTFATTGLPAQVTVVNDASIIQTSDFTTGTDPDTGISPSSALGNTNTCLVGPNVLGTCVSTNWRKKTLWQESGAP